MQAIALKCQGGRKGQEGFENRRQKAREGIRCRKQCWRREFNQSCSVKHCGGSTFIRHFLFPENILKTKLISSFSYNDGEERNWDKKCRQKCEKTWVTTWGHKGWFRKGPSLGENQARKRGGEFIAALVGTHFTHNLCPVCSFIQIFSAQLGTHGKYKKEVKPTWKKDRPFEYFWSITVYISIHLSCNRDDTVLSFVFCL